MKAHDLYQELKSLAAKLEVTVSEQNLRETGGIRVRSGLCLVRGRRIFIMDKHQSIGDKIELLLECLRALPHEDLYVVPAVRELLNAAGAEKGGSGELPQ